MDVKEFYNGKPLFHILEKEPVISHYRYDRGKENENEKYREITYFLTDIHLIRVTAQHHKIKVEKWRIDDFKKIEKEYEIRMFNTIESLYSTQVNITTSKEIITIPIPDELTRREQMNNFIELIKHL